MTEKKDLLWLLFAIGVFVFSLIFFLKNQTPEVTISPNDLPIGKELTVVALIEENDCVNCIEKLLCNWSSWQENFETNMPALSANLFFVSEQGEDFARDNLSPLCQIPEPISFVHKSHPGIKRLVATATPTVMIYFNNRPVLQVPIFSDTQMSDFETQLNQTLLNMKMSLGL